ncbi:MAG: septum formation inhibitor Maf [Rhodothermia bacterium]|nr:septum formation inhibitor Maf [Rhodothermia bacterium]
MVTGIQFVLASGSPRRARLLSSLGMEFDIVPARVSEEVDAATPPRQVVEALALRKARHVAQEFPNALVLGADTIVTLGDTILGKPEGPADAERMLRALSGNSHRVYTGIALVHAATEKEVVSFESTRVTFAEMTEAEIRAYVAGGSPMDKAGAYGIQDDLGAAFISEIEGDYYCVMGLPVHRLYTILKSDFTSYVSLESRLSPIDS